MAPQNKPAPAAAAEAENAESVTIQEGAHNPYAHALLQQAAQLDDKKKALFGQIGANRDQLRGIKATGMCSPTQATAIDEWYPVKQTAKQKAAAEAATAPAA